jgi:hypothetical protein
MDSEKRLIKYRDAGLHTYTYFWVDSRDKVCSPYFDSESQAKEWMKNEEGKISH